MFSFKRQTAVLAHYQTPVGRLLKVWIAGSLRSASWTSCKEVRPREVIESFEEASAKYTAGSPVDMFHEAKLLKSFFRILLIHLHRVDLKSK